MHPIQEKGCLDPRCLFLVEAESHVEPPYGVMVIGNQGHATFKNNNRVIEKDFTPYWPLFSHLFKGSK